MLTPEQDLGNVPHADLDLALGLEDPEYALPHPLLPRGPRENNVTKLSKEYYVPSINSQRRQW